MTLSLMPHSAAAEYPQRREAHLEQREEHARPPAEGEQQHDQADHQGRGREQAPIAPHALDDWCAPRQAGNLDLRPAWRRVRRDPVGDLPSALPDRRGWSASSMATATRASRPSLPIRRPRKMGIFSTVALSASALGLIWRAVAGDRRCQARIPAARSLREANPSGKRFRCCCDHVGQGQREVRIVLDTRPGIPRASPRG